MKFNAWINLPIKEVKRSKEFFTKLGATFVEHETETMFGIYLGENRTQIMMFTHPEFEQFTQAKIADSGSFTEVLISMEASSKAEVDELAQKIVEAGGSLFAGPESWQGWMYGMGFQDLDGHRWNIAYMDWENRPE
ncbi:MAG: VOC family protein [Balneolales bacterium]|nr:VOC family protein [Balneolales bacterium]